MRLRTLHQDENVDEHVQQFPLYLIRLDKGKLQVQEKETTKLPSSVKFFSDILSVINQVF